MPTVMEVFDLPVLPVSMLARNGPLAHLLCQDGSQSEQATIVA